MWLLSRGRLVGVETDQAAEFHKWLNNRLGDISFFRAAFPGFNSIFPSCFILSICGFRPDAAEKIEEGLLFRAISLFALLISSFILSIFNNFFFRFRFAEN